MCPEAKESVPSPTAGEWDGQDVNTSSELPVHQSHTLCSDASLDSLPSHSGTFNSEKCDNTFWGERGCSELGGVQKDKALAKQNPYVLLTTNWLCISFNEESP